jgi:3-phenylpropionate/trans-cinnamate dioxygenase ferredoxin subunit
MSETAVCAAAALPPGVCRLVARGMLSVGVYNLGGAFYALEDRCSHDDGPLCEGEYDVEAGVVVCPRHGARFDIRSGRPLTLPAVETVATYPVSVRGGIVVVDLDSPLVAA